MQVDGQESSVAMHRLSGLSRLSGCLRFGPEKMASGCNSVSHCWAPGSWVSGSASKG